MAQSLSIIIPTRERAEYLAHCVRTCLQSPLQNLEVLILDNASTDMTPSVVVSLTDPRVRYVRNQRRLSMRDNFEKGLQLAQGDVLCCIGDDDGLLAHAPEEALEILDKKNLGALSATRAHYRWPDLLVGGKNTALVPRRTGVTILNSREQLRILLKHCDYYRLPCLYHGFVRRSVVQRVLEHQDRFYLSSQVDMYSAIALSMEDIEYAFSRSPLIINGSSKRSNGASHFGGGGSLEKALWKKEDDLGFLPGFENSCSIGALVVESALRYAKSNAKSLGELVDVNDVEYVLNRECELRRRAGHADPRQAELFETAGLDHREATTHPRIHLSDRRAPQLAKKFVDFCPVTLDDKGITNVFQCALHLQELLANRHVGFADHPLEQISAALRSLAS